MAFCRQIMMPFLDFQIFPGIFQSKILTGPKIHGPSPADFLPGPTPPFFPARWIPQVRDRSVNQDD